MFLPFAQETSRSASIIAPDRHVVRSREMLLNLPKVAALGAVDQKAELGTQILTLNLFDDVVFTAISDTVIRTERGFTWSGKLVGIPESAVIFSMSNGVVAGKIETPTQKFNILNVNPGIYRIGQIDESLLPPDHSSDYSASSLMAPEVNAHKLISELPMASTDDGSFIDVMVLYTPAARLAAGGTSQMTALIDLAVADVNLIYKNSSIVQRVRLAGASEVNYLEDKTDAFGVALDCITSKTDGCLDSIHANRDANKADLVSLWIEDKALCGLGWVGGGESRGFSVVSRSCALDNASFAHEMGHNMGASHDMYVDKGKAKPQYSHGWVNVNLGWRTNMAYADACTAVGVRCPKAPYFSNPNLSYQGATLGDPSTADNARLLNETRLTIANYRVSSAAAATSTSTIEVSGIYQSTADSSLYLTVYQKNQTLITTTYTNIPLSGSWRTTLPGGSFAPRFLDYFTVLNGSVTGLQGTVSGFGINDFRSCSIAGSMVFTATSVTFTITSSTASSQGKSQGVNCQILDPVGARYSFNKIL